MNHTSGLSAAPDGVWQVRPGTHGELVLDEFGDETRVVVRSFRAEAAPLAALRSRAAAQRAEVPVVWDEEVVETWSGKTAVLARGETEASRHLHVLIDHGDIVVGVSVHDLSGLEAEALDTLAREVLARLDVDDLSRKARAPEDVPVSPATLVPWLLQAPVEGVPLVCTLANDVAVTVGALAPPHVRLLPADHPWWTDPGPEGLLALARMNVIRHMLAEEVPLTVRGVGDQRALVIGPHPVALSTLFLPDLGLLGRSRLGAGAPLVAHLVRRDLLVIAPDHVAVDVPAWAPSLPIVG